MKPLMVSVSGVRGVVGETLDPLTIARYAGAYATVIGGGRVAVGTDTRPSRDMVRTCVCAALTAAGCDVLDLGICPTPSVQLMVEKFDLSGGVSVTASHNPIEWNACKFYGSDGMLLTRAQAEKVWAIADSGDFGWVDVGKVGRVQAQPGAAEAQIEAALSVADVDAVRNARLKVVVDCVNGAGSVVSGPFLQALGCEVVLINSDVDGGFPHPPEPLPENLGALCEAVVSHGADVGFAQDPDADRLAIVDERGVPMGEEYTLALCVKRVLSRKKGPVVANLSTSRMIDDIAEGMGCPVRRSPVGEANVAEEMRKADAVIGGEGNGGVMDPAVHLVRDSFVAMAHVLSLMAATGKSPSKLARELPSYVIVKKKFRLESSQAKEAIMKRVADALSREGELDTRDGVKLSLPRSWVHVRPSGTEPVLRVIAEAPTREEAEALCAKAARATGAVS